MGRNRRSPAANSVSTIRTRAGAAGRSPGRRLPAGPPGAGPGRPRAVAAAAGTSSSNQQPHCRPSSHSLEGSGAPVHGPASQGNHFKQRLGTPVPSAISAKAGRACGSAGAHPRGHIPPPAPGPAAAPAPRRITVKGKDVTEELVRARSEPSQQARVRSKSVTPPGPVGAVGSVAVPAPPPLRLPCTLLATVHLPAEASASPARRSRRVPVADEWGSLEPWGLRDDAPSASASATATASITASSGLGLGPRRSATASGGAPWSWGGAGAGPAPGAAAAGSRPRHGNVWDSFGIPLT
ncbi:Protein NPAT [Frankliniella fusca]|uniref:Protein NPAT n=1 Tax=Frankliniella fusca TaxID=407009 RepID=A0AAE1LHE2_9NEOP|nr:Protein NPAT [Frankliniella fusca]